MDKIMEEKENAALLADKKARSELAHLLGPGNRETEIFREKYWPLFQQYRDQEFAKKQK